MALATCTCHILRTQEFSIRSAILALHHGVIWSQRALCLQMVNDPGLVQSGMPNTQDPNLNVGLPVFTIHGNHDDPAGTENLSAVDILSTVHYVNYFGKHVFGHKANEDVGKVDLSPLLLQKVRLEVGWWHMLRSSPLHV